jgi:hypothetical protein
MVTVMMKQTGAVTVSAMRQKPGPRGGQVFFSGLWWVAGTYKAVVEFLPCDQGFFFKSATRGSSTIPRAASLK